MSLFKIKRKQQETIIGSEEIHREFMEAGKSYATTLQTCIETVNVPEDVIQKLKILESLGLKNTNNAVILRDSIQQAKEINNTKQFNLEGIKFLVRITETFGENVFLVPYNNFIRLLEKYNLICGLPESYTGTIPENNLEELVRFTEKLRDNPEVMLNNYMKHEIITKVVYYTSLSYLSEDTILQILREKVVRFPFILGEDLELSDQEFLNNISGRYKGIDGVLSKDRGTERSIYICAPPNMIKPLVEIESGVYPLDPIVFCLTKFGVLIPTMWGTEAEDETIRRYKEATGFLGRWVKDHETAVH